MLGPLSQCVTCTRLQSWIVNDKDTASCEAFPDGIPDEVWTNGRDHRQAIQGDHGIRWKSNGEPYPEWALPAPADN